MYDQIKAGDHFLDITAESYEFDDLIYSQCAWELPYFLVILALTRLSTE
jgi:hypothetical protein